MTANPRFRFRFPLVVLAMACLPGAGCDDGLSPEERTQTLSVVSGDQQGGLVGAPLAQPLVVRALDSNGRPVRRATVEWQAAAGHGTMVPATSETDDDGRATATWTLGTAAGEQGATAKVGATVTVALRATALPGPATAITLTPSPLLLDAIGATGTLSFVARDAFGNTITGRAPTWTSTATNIANVVAGVVTAVAPGIAQVRAALDGANAEVEVRVQPVPASIVVSPASPQIAALGATVQLAAAARDRNGNPVTVPAQDFVWSTSNAQVVSVSPTGLAMAVANGNAQVRAALGTVIGQTTVTVQQVPATLAIVPRTDTLTTAKPFVALGVNATDANNQPIVSPSVTWTSSNLSVATVTPGGVVNAVANGSAWIRAASGTLRDSVQIVVRLNTAPRPVADLIAAEKDVQKVVVAPGLLANDTLGIPAGAITSFGDGSLGGTAGTNAAGTTVNFGTGGSLRVNADGSLTFMPSTGFTGDFTFGYRVSNSAGSGDAVVTIQVGVAPIAANDTYSTAAGTTLAVPVSTGVLANDTQGFPAATILSFGGGGLGGTVTSFAPGQLVAFGVGGFLRINADGSLSFTPPTGFTGAFTVQYRLSNGVGTSDATITINVS